MRNLQDEIEHKEKEKEVKDLKNQHKEKLHRETL